MHNLPFLFLSEWPSITEFSLEKSSCIKACFCT